MAFFLHIGRAFLGKVASALRLALALGQSFAANTSGSPAVEFTLMAPMMIGVWFCGIVAVDSYSADRKITLLSRTLADLTTQSSTVSWQDMKSIFNATEAVLWPQAPKKIGMRVTSFVIDADKKVFVDWSHVSGKGYNSMAQCTSYEIPANLLIPGSSIVLAEVSMTYQASIATIIVDEFFGTDQGRFALNDTLFMRPRLGSKVTYGGSKNKTCPNYKTL